MVGVLVGRIGKNRILRGVVFCLSWERTECFRREPRLGRVGAPFCEDYDEPIYGRGHMVPNADMKRSEAAMINTYKFSNMVPQHGEYNRKIWDCLEGSVRDWARTKGEIYIIRWGYF